MKKLLLLLALALAPLTTRAAAADSGVKLGLQTWTCRNLTFEQTVDFASAHGLKYIEFFPRHLDPAAPREETLRKKALLDQRGLVAYAFGVAATSLDKEANRKLFEFARLLGIKLIIVEPKNPAEWDNLEELVREFDIRLAVHNHWRGSPYGDPAKVRELLAKRDPRIGVCLDLGWITAAGYDAATIFREYGDRVFDLHFKDKKAERSPVQTPISDTDLGAPADQPKTPIRTGVAVLEQLAWIDTEAGCGAVNFASVFAEIKKSGWSGVMAIETDSTAFAADPHPLVTAGVEFFRTHAP